LGGAGALAGRYAAPPMDVRRLRAGDWMAAVSGVVLFVSLFLPWYGDASGWESLAVIDVLLALVAAAGVALLVVTASQPVAAVPIAVSALVTLLALIALVLVLLRVASVPDGADGRDLGLWLALIAALGLAGSAWLAMSDERGGSPPPEIEPMPAPGPE
jgi:hypothetical protein